MALVLRQSLNPACSWMDAHNHLNTVTKHTGTRSSSPAALTGGSMSVHHKPGYSDVQNSSGPTWQREVEPVQHTVEAHGDQGRTGPLGALFPQDNMTCDFQSKEDGQ